MATIIRYGAWVAGDSVEDENLDASRSGRPAELNNGSDRRAHGNDPVVIQPLQWLLEDLRPQGYVQTTDLRLRAKTLGIRYQDVIPAYLRRPWRALLKKAKTRGLTEEECRRVSEYSIIIAHKLRKAIEVRSPPKE